MRALIRGGRALILAAVLLIPVTGWAQSSLPCYSNCSVLPNQPFSVLYDWAPTAEDPDLPTEFRFYRNGVLVGQIPYDPAYTGPIAFGYSAGIQTPGTYVFQGSAFKYGQPEAFGLPISVFILAPTPPPPPPPPPVTLTLRTYKVKGVQMVDLTWSGLSGSTVRIFRNGVAITLTANDGSHTDNINKKGGGTYTYKVCTSDNSTCSPNVTVSF